MKARAVLILSGLAAFALAVPAAGLAQQATPDAMPRIDAPMPKVISADVTPESGADVGPDAGLIDSEAITGAVMNEKDMLQYCVNISDEAREARYALISRKLEETETEIDAKLVSLDDKLKAIREYVEVRDAFQKAAETQVVTIFQSMRPDAAAQQLARLDMRLAAAIVMRLDPKVSSVILAEMQPKAAATLTSFLTAAMLPEDKKGTER